MRSPIGAACLLVPVVLPHPVAAEMSVSTIRYQCERAVEVVASYVNSDDGSAAVLSVEGRQIALVTTRSASGARYAWPSDGSGYVWWTKGEAASLLWHDAEAGEEHLIYAECRQA